MLTNPPIQPLMRALHGHSADRPPFWLMRQAGRYLPEYRALRAQAGSFLDLCFNPARAAEITLQPLRRFDMDAAILFSDILVIPHALGQKLWFEEGEGPRLARLEDTRGFSALTFDAFNEKLSPIYDTVARVRAQLSPEKTLIGFAGAPWTVACYMLNGKGDAHAGGAFAAVQDFANTRPQDFQRLIDILTEATARYLIAQIKAGADAVQLFDSWAGALQGDALEKWVIAPTRAIVTAVRAACPQTPVIGFARGIGQSVGLYAAQTGIQAAGIDQSISIAKASALCAENLCLQGNLAPDILLKGGLDLTRGVEDILRHAHGRPFVFNLGHGIIKETPIAHVEQLSRIVKGLSA